MPRGETLDVHLFVAGMMVASTVMFLQLQVSQPEPLGWNGVGMFALATGSVVVSAFMRLPKHR